MKKVIEKFTSAKIVFLTGAVCSLVVGFLVFDKYSVRAFDGEEKAKRFTVQKKNDLPPEIERSGSPWIKMQPGKQINSEYAGRRSAIEKFENGALRPSALLGTDFNFDGYPDVISGFGGTDGGGVVAFHKGNRQAFAPTDADVLDGIRRAEFPVSFEKEATILDVPAVPDFVAAGNFVAGSPLDLIVAERGGRSIYVFSSDGRGNFDAPREIRLDGAITAIAADRLDSAKAFSGLIVATKNNGGELLIFSGEQPIFAAEADRTALGRTADSLVLAARDGLTVERDLFVLGDGAISRISQIGGENPSVSVIATPFRVTDFALGEFVRDRLAKPEIAVLADHGSVYYLRNGALDTRPWTDAEIRRHHKKYGRGNRTLTDSIDADSSSENDWTIAEEFHLGIYEPARQSSQSLLQKAYITGNATEDLLVTNPADGTVRVLFKEPNYDVDARSFSKDSRVENIAFPNAPAVVLPARLNVMGQQGIVVLESGELEPTPVVFAPNATFNVTKVADTNDGVCDGDCSLREAIIAANNAAGADNITFASNGAHQITIVNAGDDLAAGGDLDVRQTLTITGNGATNTILQGGSAVGTGIDKVMSINPSFNLAFATSITGVTMRFGRNQTSFGTDGFGGAFDWDAAGTGTLTVSDTNLTDNRTTDGVGGGMAATSDVAGSSPAVTLTNMTVSGNVPARSVAGQSPNGGGIYFGGNVRLLGTNLTVTNNNVNGSGGNGQGGGLFLNQTNGSPALSTLTNSTVSNNSAPSDGGGIYSGKPISFTNPTTFNGNSSGRSGGAIFLTTGGTTTISEANFTNNTATLNGGAIHNAAGTLNANFSRFFGNAAPTGSGIIVVAGTVNVENNWWSCNAAPTAAPCNTAVATGGTIDFDPRLELRLTAGATTLVTGQTTVLTASFLTNSAGTAIAASNLDAFVGIPVAFGATGANISGAQPTIQSTGTATANFFPPTVGAKTATTTVDGVTVTLNLTVNKANTSAVITGQSATTTNQGQSFTVSYSVAVDAPGSRGAVDAKETPPFETEAVSPASTVTISDGAQSCTATVAAGQCSLALSTVGVRTLTATYNGDANYNSDVSPGVSHTVLGPTSAAVSVAGKVLNKTGYGIGAATVLVRRGNGEIFQSVTDTSGDFKIEDLPAGETYILTAEHPDYQFSLKVFTANEDMSIQVVSNN